MRQNGNAFSAVAKIKGFGGLSFPFFLTYHAIMEEEASEFIATLLHSSTVTHFMHLSTDSYSVHKALGKYYVQIIDLADAFAEAFQGRYKKIKSYPDDFHSGKDPVKYLQSLQKFVDGARADLPQDSELQNIIDEIVSLIDKTLYRLKFLD